MPHNDGLDVSTTWEQRARWLEQENAGLWALLDEISRLLANGNDYDAIMEWQDRWKAYQRAHVLETTTREGESHDPA